MLGTPNMRMDVVMRTMSKLARPIRIQFTEFFICGLGQ
jgi:hypothetical protein